MELVYENEYFEVKVDGVLYYADVRVKADYCGFCNRKNIIEITENDAVWYGGSDDEGWHKIEPTPNMEKALENTLIDGEEVFENEKIVHIEEDMNDQRRAEVLESEFGLK